MSADTIRRACAVHPIVDLHDPRQRPTDTRSLLARFVPFESLTVVTTSPAPIPPVIVAGPRWLDVVAPTHTAPDLAWIAADLRDALAQTRGLRVLRPGGDDPDGRVAHVEVDARDVDDGVEVTVRIDADDLDRGLASFTVVQPRGTLHHLGADLAAGVASRLKQPPPAARRDSLDASASELYVQARRAYLMMHHDLAIELYQAALARAPGNPLIRVGLTIARIQAAFLYREAQPDETADLRAAAEDAVRDHGELGESHLARARVRIALGDTAGAARSLCDAIARAPSLVEAYVLLADTLLDISRLPDAARRLDIALALDRSSACAWTCRARQYAYEDRWDELYTLAIETFPELGLRGVILPRLVIWRPRRDVLEFLERFMAARREDLPRHMWQGAQLLIAFGLEREDRGVLVGRMETRFVPSTNLRRNCFMSQIICELACAHGDMPRAVKHLQAADSYLLADWEWIERCPLLTSLRREPTFAVVRARVRLRADAIADAIWG